MNDRSIAVSVSAVALLAGASIACGQALNVNISGTMPTYGQHHDFRATLYSGNSLIKTNDNTAFVTFPNLAADARVRVKGSGFQARPLADDRDFENADYYTTDAALYDSRENLAGGGWSCAPTSASMVYDWFRTEKLKKLTNRGNPKATIEYFSTAASTNNFLPEGGTANRDSGFGTMRRSIWNALGTAVTTSHADYAKASGPRVKDYAYAEKAYNAAIDKDRAVMLHYRGLAGTAGGHVVAGFGYSAFGTGPHPPGTIFGPRVIDPWDRATKIKDKTQIAGAVANIDYTSGNPRTTPFTSPWGDATMGLIAIPDYGDAPYEFEDDDLITGSTRPAASHRDSFAQWLGRSVSGETNVRDALDDEDRIANSTFDRPNMDSDDGAVFTYNPDGSVFAVVTSTKMDFSREFTSPDAPNSLFLSVFADNDQDMDFRTGFHATIALGEMTFNGTGAIEQIVSNLLIPAAADQGQFWVRFRLSRDANVDAYGMTEYGEVEDYLVPTPGTLALAGTGLMLLARRRRLA